MGNKLKVPGFYACAAVVFGILAALTIIIQISTANQNTTKLESSLFSILQFVFTICFAWIIAKLSLKNEFQESQKKFAISAFRRINEIDLGVKRLLLRVRNELSEAPEEGRRQLEVIEAIALGAADNVKASMADWGDVIGEELVTLQKIESLTENVGVGEEAIPLAAKEPVTLDHSKQARNTEMRQNKEIDKLIESLPVELQTVARTRRRNSMMDTIKKLDLEAKEKGYAYLEGFWDENCERDIRTLSIGDILTVKVGDIDLRIGGLVAYDMSGKSVGVIVNSLGAESYNSFQGAVLRHAGKSSFNVEITEIDDKASPGSRYYFIVRIIDYSLVTRHSNILEELNRRKQSKSH